MCITHGSWNRINRPRQRIDAAQTRLKQGHSALIVIILVAICLFLKCRKAQQEARARGSTNWQAPPPSVELGKPEPAPGHWRPADEMQTQQPV